MNMPFGKHRGVPISQIDDGYLAWVLDTCHNANSVLRDFIKRELDRRSGFDDDPEPTYTGSYGGGPPDVSGFVDDWFRRLALRFHPDRDGGSHQAMVAVNVAKELLLEMASVLVVDEDAL